MQITRRTSLLLATAALGACTSTGKLQVRAIPDRAAAVSSAANGVGVARAQLALGNAGLALEEFRKLQRSRPSDPAILAGIGDCYAAMGRPDVAQSSYEAALALSPHNPDLLFALAAILDNQGQHARANQARADARAASPELPAAGSVTVQLPAATATADPAPVEPVVEQAATAAREPSPKAVPAILVVAERMSQPRLERLSFGEVALVTASSPANPLPVADRPKELARSPSRPSSRLLATLLLSAEPAFRPLRAADPRIAEAEHAIAAGRLEQARLMAARLSAAGSTGPEMDRLLANLDFAGGNLDQAVARYELLLKGGLRDEQVCNNGAVAAVRLGHAQQGRSFADCAIEIAPQSAQAWNTRAVVADLMQDWATADASYARARALSPDRPDLVNNQGWSLLLRGHWADALPLLEEAAALDPRSDRVRNNLELAKAAMSSKLPQRASGELASDWSVRLNDAGVAARLLGDRTRAFAAFTQAIEAKPTWYARAWNNLRLARE